jgi:hypothetical protein
VAGGGRTTVPQGCLGGVSGRAESSSLAALCW